jgi:hypothetical protein
LATSAVIAVAFGLAFVLASGPSLALYGITLDRPGALMTQFFGAALIGIGIINWSARTAPDGGRAVILGNLVGDAIGFAVALTAELGGVANALGWLTVGLYLLLGAGFAYFQFIAPAGAVARASSSS